MLYTEATSWHTYPNVYALGHHAIKNLLDGPVIVQEKIDGSQISFGMFNGELRVRSKGKQIDLNNPEKLFLDGIDSIYQLKDHLIDGYTYRGEYLRTPHHNVLAYNRIPIGHIILYDINTSHEQYLPYMLVKIFADELTLECVKTFSIYEDGHNLQYEDIEDLLKLESVLGGQQIEGVVIKNYSQFGADKKVLMGKFVSERFKEVAKVATKKQNKGRDVVGLLKERYKTEARWDKAIQHLRELGELEESPRDIGKLVEEIQADVEKECGDEIRQALYNWGWKQIKGGLTVGFAEYYKKLLMEKQFETSS